MGAQRRSVVGLVLGETARVAALGIGLGLAGAVAAGTATRALLFDTPPWDAPTLLLVAAVLAWRCWRAGSPRAARCPSTRSRPCARSETHQGYATLTQEAGRQL
jgi:hypothetical protein